MEIKIIITILSRKLSFVVLSTHGNVMYKVYMIFFVRTFASAVRARVSLSCLIIQLGCRPKPFLSSLPPPSPPSPPSPILTSLCLTRSWCGVLSRGRWAGPGLRGQDEVVGIGVRAVREGGGHAAGGI